MNDTQRLERIDARLTEVLVRLTRLETIVEERTKKVAAFYGMLAAVIPVLATILYQALS